MSGKIILTVRCPDRPGIVSTVASFLFDNGATIQEAHQYCDPETVQFYMRIAFSASSRHKLSADSIALSFQEISHRFSMQADLYSAETRPKVLIAASRFGHCLFDLMHKWKSGLLPIEIVGVVSNHDIWRSFVEWNGVPFHFLPIRERKEDQEEKIATLIDELDVDLLVLARYMQVLSPNLCEKLKGACINIHHSFLPSFAGARPYHQAYARGVKLIGATAHYVTKDLDEGPIIEQDIERVDHGYSVEQLVELGRDVEARVLARAVRWHAERRILLAGSKTVVFR